MNKLTVKNSELRVYEAFYELKEEMLYFNEIKDFSKLADSSLSNLLKSMVADKQLKKTSKKYHTYYKLIDKEKTKVYFTLLDINKVNSLNYKIKVIIKELIKQIPNEINFASLFGSTLTNKMNKNSDIDILIVLNKFDDEKLQKLYDKEIISKINEIISKLNARSLYPLSIHYSYNYDFLNNPSILDKEVKNKGLIIKNHHNYYEEIIDES